MTSSPIDPNRALQHIHLVCVDPSANANKFWNAWLMPDGTIYTERGRVNYSPHSHTYTCGSLAAATRKFATLVRQKQAKGYEEVVADTDSLEQLDWSALARNVPQLRSKLRDLQQLGEAIARHCSIQFDPTRGTFQTALGTLSPAALDRARAALTRVRETLASGNRLAFDRAVGDYLVLIPLPVGMKLDAATLLGSTERIEAQQTCLRQLEIGFSLVEQLRSQLLQAAPAESDRAWWIDWGVSSASPPGTSKVGLPQPGER